MTWFAVWIEINLVFMLGGTCFQSDRNWLVFRVIESDSVFMRGAKLTWILCANRKILGFKVWIEIDLVFVCGPKMTCFLCWDRLA